MARQKRAMGRDKLREQRVPLCVRARMRFDGSWHDVTIGNASSRGMLLEAPLALERQTFIEVRHCDQVIVGRVVWNRGKRCGIRTQDDVDIALLAGSPSGTRRPPGIERRRSARPPVVARPRSQVHDAFEQSRLLARSFDFASILLFAVAGAAAVYHGSQQVLGDILHLVIAALDK
ncbi:PilZ domain-containing protein [Tsuneonella sp. HG222]